MNKFKISAILGAAALIPTAASAGTVQVATEGPIIELSVFENVTVEPDMATIGAGVTSDAPTAVEALRQNSEQMRKVIDRIKALGIAERDIQTSGISLNARYDYNRPDQRPVFRGYQASNRVTVKLRKIADTGRVLDELVTAGATDLSGPDFSIEKDEQAKDEARKRAVARGQERALSYARMVGYDNVRVVEISEAIEGNGPVPMMRRAASDSAIVVTGSAPVQPGMIDTGVNVTITYQMIRGN